MNTDAAASLTPEMQHLMVRALIEGPAPVMITDGHANILYVNRRFTELTGYSLDDLAGKNPRVLSAGQTPPEIYQALWQAIRSGKTWDGNLLNKRKNGDLYWESISISPLLNAGGTASNFIGVWRDVSLERAKAVELEKKSVIDELTGIYNRRAILDEMGKEMERAKRYNHVISGMMVDVDNFKAINDRHGHTIGDRVLRTFASVLKASVRKMDLVGRYGGDEFLIILPESDLKMGMAVAERIRKILKTYAWNVLQDLGEVTGSFGLFSFQDTPPLDRTAFVEKMDHALLSAKRAGKDRIIIGD